MTEIDIEQLKQQISIKDLISQYTHKPIRNNKLCCPLPDHQDDTPSFQIYEETNSFYCHGCNHGGDVIKFIELAEGIDFIDAIKHLTGEDRIKFNTNFNNLETDDLLDIIENMKDTQKPNFSDDIVMEYCKNKHSYFLDKGYKQKTLDYFNVGFCFDMSDLHNRAIIPWKDVNDNIVAIVGRDVEGNSKAKYKAKFGSNKQSHLYNLNNAKKYSDQGLIVVESEKDVWRLYEFGFKNAIALGNSSLNGRKWLLMEYTNTVILCLDNDPAGKKATQQAIKELKPLMEVYVIELEGVKDIGEIQEKEEWLKFYNKRRKI